MMYPAQGVQKTNHTIVFTNSRCKTQRKRMPPPTKELTSGHPYKGADVTTNRKHQ